MIAPLKSASLPALATSPAAPSVFTTRLRLLHLEDSLADQRLVALCLRQANWPSQHELCDIEATDSLQSFQDALSRNDFDIILADYYLQGFTAMQAWSWMQQPQNQSRYAHTPFVLLSGAIGEAAAVEAMRQGISDYLLKDDMARLPHVLTRALEMAEARRAKEQAQQQLAALTEHLQISIEEERAAIAREIHDDIGGALTAVKFDLAWISRNALHAEKTRADIHQHADAALEMLQHALGASQRIMLNLRPPVLDQGLVAAVQWLVQSFSQRTGIKAQMVHSSPHSGAQIAPQIQVVAYRTAQEALTNVSKYAQASEVYVELSDGEGFLTLEVRDNGCGIDSASRDKPQAFGLRGLSERARTVGGWLDVSTQPGRGTSIIVSIPLKNKVIS